jgi:hypothetical protein
MPKPLLPWFLGLGLHRTLRQILETQQAILELLQQPRAGLSPEDRAALEQAVTKLETLAHSR